jgi:hypothetical protein
MAVRAAGLAANRSLLKLDCTASRKLSLQIRNVNRLNCMRFGNLAAQ